jgi:hypothetical protein
MARPLFWGTGIGALMLIANLALLPKVLAEKVGVAAAVNPDAFSSLAGAPKTQLDIGKSIFYNERINTTTSGLVQVLLVDGSTFTVGPGSDLVIDKFIYDPKKETGQIAASFSKGVMRFVGGKISKKEGGVTIGTPAGALAVRGGIAYGQFISPKNFAFLFVFGDHLKMNGLTVFQPGNGIFSGIFSENGRLVIKPFNAADVNAILVALTNSDNGGLGNKPSDGPNPSTAKLVNTLSLNQLISDANTTQIQGEADKALANTQPTSTTDNTPPTSTTDNTPPTSTTGNTPPTSTTGNTPPTGTTDNTPPTGITDNTPPTGTTDNTPSTGTTDNTPSTGTTDNTPSTSATDNTPPTGTTGETLPAATPGEIGAYAAGMRSGSGKDAPATLESVVFNPANKQISFRLDGDDSDLVSIAFNSDGQATKDSVSVSQGGKQARVNSVSQTTLTTKQQLSLTSWGRWEAHIEYKYEDPNKKSNLFASGWWVSGELTTVGNIDTLAALGATATYTGTVEGTVASNLRPGDWKTYDASGNLTMDWSFRDRNGDLSISNFDERSYSTGPQGLTQPSLDINKFGGSLTQTGGPDIGLTSGSATGSFVNNGSTAAGGIVGNWSVGGPAYRATGIFAGSGTPY